MRGYFVYYLKILLAISLIAQLASSAIKISMDDAYKKLLALRSLPFEDCGKYVVSSYLFKYFGFSEYQQINLWYGKSIWFLQFK